MFLWCPGPGCDEDLMNSVAFARPLPGSPTHTRLEACACLDSQVWHFLALLSCALKNKGQRENPNVMNLEVVPSQRGFTKVQSLNIQKELLSFSSGIWYSFRSHVRGPSPEPSSPDVTRPHAVTAASPGSPGNCGGAYVAGGVRSGGCGGAISGMGDTMPRSVELSCVPEGMQPAMVSPFWSLGAKVLRELTPPPDLWGFSTC